MATVFDAMNEASSFFTKVCDGPVDSELFNSAISSIERCIQIAREADLFSKNEEIEEYSMRSLKVVIFVSMHIIPCQRSFYASIIA
jgi:TAP42-like family